MPQQLIVTGSSAGGIEALTTMVASLPKDLPAPIVVAQHLDPATQSALAQILGRHSVLPIRVVENREPLTSSTIFVVPANRHVSITDHEVVVSQKGPEGARPSVDLLFSTASANYGERLIAVILSGMGSDGAVGARMVKKNGGTVIIQDPETAKFPSMPLSLPSTSVDIVSKVESIGPLLKDLVTGVYLPKEEEHEKTVRLLLSQIRDISGIDFSNYKMPTIMRRLSRLMVASGCETLEDYVTYLRKNPEGYQRLISSFLIKVTEFFRDPDLFSYLRETVMPPLIEAAQKDKRELRMWSAGCATGEESYSLAIFVCELLGDTDHVTVRIFATDLDNEAITYARRGIYAPDALEAVPKELLDKYFTQVDGGFEVKKSIRSLVIFGQHDLGQRAPFPRLDLCLCRNVLIYFTRELQQRALRLFAYSLRPGGILALGKSETAPALPDVFETANSQLKVYRRKEGRSALPIRDSITTTPAPRLTRPMEMNIPSFVERRPRSTLSEELGEHMMRVPSLGVVWVNRRYDIQLINTAARDLLNIRTVGIDEDLIHLLGPQAGLSMRKAIDAAFSSDPSRAGMTELEITSDVGDQHYVDVTCHAGKPPNASAPDACVILITEATEAVKSRIALEAELSSSRSQIEKLTTDKGELAERQRQLIEANSDVSRTNADLLANNERLTISVEEAESATEEVETLNEEMQATNEELETVNEEMQATIEELNTTSDELEARTAELQELAIARESQRSRVEESRANLADALHAMPEPIVLVDSRGKIMFGNEAFKRLEKEVEKKQAKIVDFEGKSLTLGDAMVRLVDSGTEKVRIRRAGNRAPAIVATSKPLMHDGERAGTMVLFRSAGPEKA